MSNDINVKKKFILLVEDEPHIAILEKINLERYGYTVKHVLNGEDAVEFTLHNKIPPDLILMDIDLGDGIDGTEAAEIILKNKDIPVVFLSSHIEPEIVEKTEKITSYGYVVKTSGTVVLNTSIKMAFKLFEQKQEINKQRTVLEKMGELAKIGTWEYCIKDSKLSWSNEVYKIYELDTKVEINIEKAMHFYTGESFELMTRAFNLAINDGKSFIRDCEIITAEGNPKWIRTQGEVSYNEDCKSESIFGTIQDVSEIRLLDRVTQESEFTLNQIEKITHIGHWSVNTVDGSFFHSDEVKRIFGYEPSEYALSVEDAINAYHPDDREEVIRLFKQAVETGDGYEFDLRIIQPNGNVRNVHSKGYTEKDQDGKVIRVYGVFQDITEQKQVEEKLKKINEELNDSLSLYHDLVETSQDLIWQCDSEGRYTYLNPAWKEVLGYEIEEMLGKPFIDFQTQEQAEKDIKEFKRLMLGNTVKGLETYHLHKDGREVPLVFNAKFLRDKEGKIAGTRGTAYDITDRKKTEKLIRQQLQEKEIFLKEVHHRIKNNLNSVKSLLEMQVDLTSNKEAKFLISEAVSRVESMQQIYYKLLHSEDYSKLSVKNYLEDLLKSIIEIFPGEEKITLNTEIDDFILDIKKIFPIGTIVNELVTNSMRHGFKGKKLKKIFISLKNTDGEAVLKVIDNGIGVPENFNISELSNSGIMLVNMLTQQLKGSFDIKSNNGTECTVKFML